MSRIRLVVGGGAPVRADRPPIIFAAGFALHARASSNVGTTGVCQMVSTAKLTAVPQQGFGNRFAANFALRGAPRFKMDGQAPFALHAAAAAAVTLFANGYTYARRLVKSAQPDLAGEDLADFPAFLDTSEVPGDWSWLLTGSSKRLSGLVGGFPADVRFELEDGTKLDHHWISYDGTAGTARWFLHKPTTVPPSPWRSDRDDRLLVYYGKAGVVATEENVAGVWQGAALVIDPITGNDLTGKGHALPRSASGLTNTTLDGRPAVLFAAGPTAYLRRTNSDLSFLDGLTDWTEEFWGVFPGTADGNVSRLGGDKTVVPPQPFTGARFSTWIEASGSVGGGANVIEAGSNRWNGANYDNIQHESVAGAADGITVRHLIVVRAASQPVQPYDGETSIGGTATTGTPTAGTLHPQSTDNYSLGAGLGAQVNAPAMTLGLYVLYPRALSATWRAMLDRTQRDSSLVWGVGAEDTFGDIAKATDSPVGKPWRQTVTAQTDIDLAPHAYDADPGSTIVGTAVTPASDAFAGYSIVASKLRVTPSPGASGTGRPVATVSDGTKTAKVSPMLTIGSTPPPVGFFKTPNIAGKTAVAVTSPAGLQTALGLFGSTYQTSTHYIKITADFGARGTTGADIAIAKGGTRAHPLVITMANAGQDTPASWSGRPTVFNSCLRLQAQWIWLYGLQMECLPTAVGVWNTTGRGYAVSPVADNLFVTACHMAATIGLFNDPDSGDALTDGLTANYNWFEIAAQSTTAVGNGDNGLKCFGGAATCTNVTGAYNRFSDHALSLTRQSANFRCFIFGQGKRLAPSFYSTNTEIAYNFMDCNYSHCMEFKVFVKSVHDNHGTLGTRPILGINPHGLNTRGDNANADAAATRPIMYRNRIKCGGWEIEGRGWDYANNWIVDAGGAIVGDFSLLPFGLNIETPPAKNIGGADGARMIANKAGLILGDSVFQTTNYSYENLGSRGTVLIAGHVGGAITDTSGGAITFDAAGHPTGTHPHLMNAQVTKQIALPAGFVAETPPVLSATTTGPGAAGATWAG